MLGFITDVTDGLRHCAPLKKKQRAWRWLSLILILFMPMSSLYSQETVVGKVSLLKGVVTAETQGQATRLLAKGSEVFLKDRIETSEDSFVVVKMADNGKLTLRPETVLEVQSYSQVPGKEQERLKLIKGGLRVLTGLIGQSRPDAVKMETRTTTIGIRGTDYIIRDCVDCEAEENALGDFSRVPPKRKGAADGSPLPVITILDADTRRVLEREEVGRIKNAIYFAVLDGKIFAQSGEERIDLEAIDACYRAGDTPTDPDEEFHCLIEIPRFVLYDRYLNNPGSADDFTLFNIFKELKDKEAICEIDWK